MNLRLGVVLAFLVLFPASASAADLSFDPAEVVLNAKSDQAVLWDADQDGDLDVVRSDQETLYLHIRGTDGAYAIPGTVLDAGVRGPLRVADVTNDGKSDLLYLTQFALSIRTTANTVAQTIAFNTSTRWFAVLPSAARPGWNLALAVSVNAEFPATGHDVAVFDHQSTSPFFTDGRRLTVGGTIADLAIGNVAGPRRPARRWKTLSCSSPMASRSSPSSRAPGAPRRASTPSRGVRAAWP
jgi:hypothetical protein